MFCLATKSCQRFWYVLLFLKLVFKYASIVKHISTENQLIKFCKTKKQSISFIFFSTITLKLLKTKFE